tara:strand:- start:11746 stop:12054 length:309 start_codon:yes stop_codon:yes gene_type:complete
MNWKMKKIIWFSLLFLVCNAAFSASISNRKITGVTNIRGEITVNAVDASTGEDLVQYTFDSKDTAIGGNGIYSLVLTAFTVDKPVKIYFENTTQLIGIAFFD